MACTMPGRSGPAVVTTYDTTGEGEVDGDGADAADGAEGGAGEEEEEKDEKKDEEESEQHDGEESSARAQLRGEADSSDAAHWRR